MDREQQIDQERILVLAPTEADRELSRKIFAEAGLDCHLCANLRQLAHKMRMAVGAVLLTEETIARNDPGILVSALDGHPSWSDVPVVVLSATGKDSLVSAWSMERLGNVTVLERPVRLITLISTLRTAIRSRRRQSELLNQMESIGRSEQQLRLITNALPAVVTYIDRDTRIRFFNRTLCDWFGLDPAEVQDRTAAEVMGESAIQVVPANMEQAFRGETVRFEAELPYLHGGTRAVEVVYVPDKHGEGRVEGYVGLIHDVSERNRAAAALAESEKRFRTLADNISQFAWTAEPLGLATWYNKRWYDYTGTTWEEMQDRGWERVIHPDHLDRVIRKLSACREKRDTWEDTFPILGKDGKYRWFLSRGVPIRDGEDNILCWFGTNTDISEQRATEEALRESESRLRQLLSLMPMAVYTCDIEGRISFFNRQAAELWGREPAIGVEDEKFCGSFRLWRSSGELLPHRDTPMAKAVHDGKSFRKVRVLVERPDGTRITVSVNIDPLHDADGRRVGAINVFEDVSDRVRAEESLKDADRRKDEFLAMLAHELRNPLAPIRTGLQVIKLCVDDREATTGTIEMMDRQLQQLVRLIDDLLDISRITRGKIELRREPCELATVLSTAVESSHPIIEEAGLELTVSAPRKRVELYADPARLSQLFSNLLTNAAKYTDRGGHIWLTAERRSNYIVVSVRDNGIGIRQEMLSDIFQLFTQVDRTDRSHGGLGIGLALVRALVEMHEGTVEARSDGPGQGSEFVVSLPITVGPPANVENSHSAEKSLSSECCRVLVVDDNQDAATTLSMMLEMMGNEVRTAHDGLEAVAVAGEFRPKLVLLDLGMPKLDGYETARHIRRQSWGRDMILAALTGW